MVKQPKEKQEEDFDEDENEDNNNVPKIKRFSKEQLLDTIDKVKRELQALEFEDMQKTFMVTLPDKIKDMEESIKSMEEVIRTNQDIIRVHNEHIKTINEWKADPKRK